MRAATLEQALSFRCRMQAHLLEIWRKIDITIIFITQEQAEEEEYPVLARMTNVSDNVEP